MCIAVEKPDPYASLLAEGQKVVVEEWPQWQMMPVGQQGRHGGELAVERLILDAIANLALHIAAPSLAIGRIPANHLYLVASLPKSLHH